MSSTTSTEPPSFLHPTLPTVSLKYIPLLTHPVIPADALTVTATDDFRVPCRRCLLDASPGDRHSLLSYDPFDEKSTSPYRQPGPIFVHTDPDCCQVFSDDKLPERQLRRLLSVRAYDEADMTRGTEIVRDDGSGVEFERVVGGMLKDEQIKWVGVYNARPGCFVVRVERGE